MFDEWRASAGSGEADERTVGVPGKPAAFAGADAVTYRTGFDDPRTGDDEVACLVLDGLFAHAEVDVPGEILGEGAGPIRHDAYFEPLRIPFRPEGDREVAVTCEAPTDRYGGLHDTDLVPDAERVPGIWWDASLESHPLPYVDDVSVRPEVTGENARLHVRTTVVTDGPLEDRVTYSLRPAGDNQRGGMMDRGAVEVTAAGKTTVEHTVDVRDPARWWPAGYGDQHRYTLRAKLGDSERTVTTGICEVERDGSDLVVNGEPVPIRGVNLLTDDPADIDRAKGLNANLVRAHAHVLPPAVYDACNEAGILVWQDLPLTGPGAFDVERGRALARALVRRYAGSPSFAALGVHDDPSDAFAAGVGDGLLDGLRLRWRAWRTGYDREPAESIADDADVARPVFPVVGAPGTAPDAGAYYPGWDYGSTDDLPALIERYPVPVVAEFGAGSLGADGGDADDVAGFDRAKHDARVDGGDVAASQSYQADVLRSVAEGLRRDGRGAVAFALRDTDAAGNGVYDEGGAEKTAAEHLATAFEPIQAFLADPGPGTSDLVVVNDAPRPVSATVSWSAGDASGSEDVTIEAAGRWRGGPVDVPADADAVALELVVGDRTVENRYTL